MQCLLFIRMWRSHKFKLMCIKISKVSLELRLYEVNKTRVHSVTEITFRNENCIHCNRHHYAAPKDMKGVLCLSSSFIGSLNGVAKGQFLVQISCDLKLRHLFLCCLWNFLVLRNFFKKTFTVWFYLIPDIHKNKTVALLFQSLQFYEKDM